MKSSLVLSLLFLGVAGDTSMVMAQSPGTFTATGNLTTERMVHTATLLTNGKVLIAGGSGILTVAASRPGQRGAVRSFHGNLHRYRRHGHVPLQSHGDSASQR